MTNTPFNTLQFARQLTDAGMSHPLAEVLADQYSQFSHQNTEHLATKAALKVDAKILKCFLLSMPLPYIYFTIKPFYIKQIIHYTSNQHHMMGYFLTQKLIDFVNLSRRMQQIY